MLNKKLTRKRSNKLGLAELIAIALGGMVGGGIFSILGISVARVGNATPIAIAVGGVLALMAAYSYVKLSQLYKDEGATYSFYKKTFTKSHFSASVIGWLVVFGYISTLGLYAFTFASYLASVLPFDNMEWLNKVIAGLIIALFAVVNIVSVKGMGRIEDWMVYTKLILLLFISGLLAGKGSIENFTPIFEANTTFSAIIIVASITFVAYEGFQLVIHAYNEMDNPAKNIPRAIYGSIVIAILIYVILAIGALSAIPKELIIKDQEFALAAGAQNIIGDLGLFVVIFGALLATSSAISGTLFGASRLIAVIANDGYFPKYLAKKTKNSIPKNAIITMGLLAFVLILSGGLQLLLEFGSVTFIIVSFLMAYANFVKRKETNSHTLLAIGAMIGLFGAAVSIFYFEYTEAPYQLVYIVSIYAILGVGAYFYSRLNGNTKSKE
ncbi:MAG: amino acid permease [Crocinitomix sp.]|nr:amino acid permease [Crocinitomix sp.]